VSKTLDFPFQKIQTISFCFCDQIRFFFIFAIKYDRVVFTPGHVISQDEKFCEESVKKLQEMLQSGPFQARVTGYRSDGCPRIHLLKCVGNDVSRSFVISPIRISRHVCEIVLPAAG